MFLYFLKIWTMSMHNLARKYNCERKVLNSKQNFPLKLRQQLHKKYCITSLLCILFIYFFHFCCFCFGWNPFPVSLIDCQTNKEHEWFTANPLQIHVVSSCREAVIAGSLSKWHPKCQKQPVLMWYIQYWRSHPNPAIIWKHADTCLNVDHIVLWCSLSFIMFTGH